MPNSEDRMCPRCHVGIDNDGDGDCSICHHIWPEQAAQLATQHNKRLVRAIKLARDEVFNELLDFFGVTRLTLGDRLDIAVALNYYRRQYPNSGDRDLARYAFEQAQGAYIPAQRFWEPSKGPVLDAIKSDGGGCR